MTTAWSSFSVRCHRPSLVPGSWFLAVPGRWSPARLGPKTSDEGPPGTEGPGIKDCQEPPRCRRSIIRALTHHKPLQQAIEPGASLFSQWKLSFARARGFRHADWRCSGSIAIPEMSRRCYSPRLLHTPESARTDYCQESSCILGRHDSARRYG